MITLAPSDPLELLAVAHMILQRKHNEALIDKVTVLQGYLELSQMSPNHDYSLMLSRAMTEVAAALHFQKTLG
jgi:hypothetical protein